jgi:predicted nucleic acid-binding protein
VWVQHFRKGLGALGALLNNDRVLCHPLIVLELSCGSPPAPRKRTLQYLSALQTASIATIDETINFVELNKLYDCGCGAVDMALLASTLLTKDAELWTLDKKLEALAKKLKVSYRPSLH